MSTADRVHALDSFKLGMNNLRPEFKLKSEDRYNPGYFVRSAVNADITDGGTAKRRSGRSQFYDGADCHSLFADGAEGFFVDGTELMRLTGTVELPSITTVLTGLAPGAAVSYARVNDLVYFSNGAIIGRIEAGAAREVCPPTPPAPSSDFGGTDTLYVVLAYRWAGGEEGAATLPVQASGNLTLLPTTWPAGVVGLAVYTSAPDSTTLLHYRTLTAPAASLAIGAGMGAQAPTLFRAPMPAGEIVRYLNGRLFVASGSVLYYSDPYMHGLYNPARNFVQFPAVITMIEPCQNGLFVAADQTYWINGEISAADLNPVLPYGAVRGASGQVPNKNECFWMSERGIVIGNQNGEVANLQEDRVAASPAQAGAALFREEDGMKQIVAPTFGPESTVMAARTYMDAEIVRKETDL